MLESILIYSLLAFIMVVCGSISADRKTKLAKVNSSSFQIFARPEMIILVFSFVFVFGCRWGVGRDYFRYLQSYMDSMPERYEFLFQAITQYLKGIDAHFAVYFGVWALLDVLLLYYSVRKYNFIFPYLAFYLILGSNYLPMMNAIRMYIAALIFLVAVSYIYEMKLWKYLACITIAYFFHRLSILLFVFYPLLRINNDWFKSIKLQLLFYGVAVFLSFYGEIVIRLIEIPFEWLTDNLGYERYRYEMLTDEKYDRSKFGNNTGLGIYINILTKLPIILMSIKIKEFYNSSHFNIFYNLFFLGVLGGLIFGKSVVLGRINMFFEPFELIIYSFFTYYCLEVNKKWQLFGFFLILIQIPLFLNIISNVRSTAQYTFFWENVYYF